MPHRPHVPQVPQVPRVPRVPQVRRVRQVPRVLGIVGPGLIGTSVGLAARRAWPLVELRLIDRGDSLEGLRGADTIVVAAPVDAIGGILAAVARFVGADTLVLDTGSTKRSVMAAAHAAGLPRFVGGHPMSGDTAGADGAHAGLFDGRPWFLMGASVETTEEARAFVAALGAQPIVLDDQGECHDRVMAAVSHLPQVTSSALMVVAAGGVSAGELAWAGAGLRDTTRLAASRADLWQGVLATNKDMLAPLLKQLASELDTLADALDDPAAVGELFDAAVRARASCL